MSFVNEKIGNDFRTIDFDRNIVLTCLGTGGNYPHKFTLKINTDIINFEAWLNEKYNPDNTIDVTWNVVRLYVSDFSQQEKIEIIQLIKEALNEYGAFARRDGVNSVIVNFRTSKMN